MSAITIHVRRDRGRYHWLCMCDTDQVAHGWAKTHAAAMQHARSAKRKAESRGRYNLCEPTRGTGRRRSNWGYTGQSTPVSATA